MGLLDTALVYAARGWCVLPVWWPAEPGRCACPEGAQCSRKPGKHPITRHGKDDATSDPARIAEWWRSWPEANIGVRAGSASRLVVIDLDGPASEESYGRLLSDHGAPSSDPHLPDGATVRTPRPGGGWHLYLRVPAGTQVACSVSKLAPGIDVRAEGGYVIAPPSRHISGGRYVWRDPIPPAGLPELSPAWCALLAAPEAPERPLAPVRLRPGGASGYGIAAARAELERVLRATEGERNARLNDAAFALGQLVAGGELAAEATRTALVDAGTTVGLGRHEVERTVTSGLRAGLDQPRSAPARSRAA